MSGPANNQPGPRQSGATVSGSVIVGIVIITLLALGLAALAWLNQVPRPIAIADIHANLREYDGSSVTVRGQVAEVMNVLGIKWYSVKDDTGSIVVLTQRGLPQQGQLITVTGIVKEVFNVGGLNGTVLQEPLAPE